MPLSRRAIRSGTHDDIDDHGFGPHGLGPHGFGHWPGGWLAALLIACSVVWSPPTATAATVLDIQAQATRESLTTESGQAVELVNLNPNIGAQYLLRIGKKSHHLQFPAYSTVTLVADGLRYVIPGESASVCVLEDASKWSIRLEGLAAFHPICGGRVYVRTAMNGSKQKIRSGPPMRASWVSWTPAQRRNYAEALPAFAAQGGFQGPSPGAADAVPPVANLKEPDAKAALRAKQLGIAVADLDGARMQAGHWYPAEHFEGMHASVVTLANVEPALLGTFKDRVASLGANDGWPQKRAMVYLIALDLRRYTLGWMHGTAHPGVAWSRRNRLRRDNRYGPDGFAKLRPLVAAGTVSPVDLPVTVGVFSGGFQRRHGAFRWGERARTAEAHHYGFLEDGVLLSSLIPSLATVIVHRNGEVALKTWTQADERTLPVVRFARQNGVPLITGGGPNSVGMPGLLVSKWGPGNWSGSADAELRTPRSAACLIEQEGLRWLVYAYFSTHTPSGMARVLQAYHCDYAVHLDMNSPGHAYFALFTQVESGLEYRTEHLMTQMRGWDPRVDRKRTPRFLLKPEYKDFFYIMRRASGEGSPAAATFER